MNIRNSTRFGFALFMSLGGCGAAEPGPAGPAGPAGSTGPAGVAEPADPQLGSLFPASAFLARTVSMQISGAGTHFTGSSTIDFADAEITVSNVSAGSSGNLRLTVQIGQKATLGAHDVTVTSGNEVVKLTQAFTVSAALQAAPVAQQPTIAQGGIYIFDLQNLDYRDNPTGITRPAMTGLSLVSYDGAAPGHLRGVGLIDALTPAGLLSITATVNDPFGKPVSYTTAATDAMLAMSSARTPVPLSNNVAKAGESLASPRASNLYKLTTAAANQLLLLSYTSLGTELAVQSPGLSTAIAPASGKFSEGVILPWTWNGTAMKGQLVTDMPVAGDYYLATFRQDYGGGATGYTYTITPKVVPVSVQSNPEPATAETPANPSLKISSLTGAISASNGTAADASDSDYVIFTAATTGSALLQITNLVPAPANYPAVDYKIYNNAACTTNIDQGSAYPPQSTTTELALTAGTTYCIEFTRGIVGSGSAPYKLLLVP